MFNHIASILQPQYVSTGELAKLTPTPYQSKQGVYNSIRDVPRCFPKSRNTSLCQITDTMRNMDNDILGPSDAYMRQ